jgi:hypothetical protein
MTDQKKLDDFYAASLGTLFTFDHVILNFGSLLKKGATDVIGMDEYVLPTILWRDKPKTLSRIEEFNRTFLHLPFSFVNFPK